jgi:glutamate carboxypeptidase
LDPAPLIDDIGALVTAESPSDDADAVRVCAEVLCRILEQRLGHPGTVGDDGRVTWEHDDGIHPPVLLLGHLDTVWPLGTLARMPFTVTDGQLTGPGVFDMKAGLVVAIHAMAAMRARGPLPSVRLLVTTDEEVGSARSRPAIEEAARACRRVLVLEPSGERGAIKSARKGVALGRVTAHGRASHAGLEPEAGLNAVVGLGALLPAIAALGDADAGTSVVPTRIRGGSAINVVPAEAHVDLDMRFLDDGEVERVKGALQELTAPHGVLLSVDLEVNRPALTPAASAPLMPALRAAAGDAQVTLELVTVGGASDGNIAAATGAAVLDGLGPAGGGAHADHEHVHVDGLAPRVRLLQALLPRVAEVVVPASV